MARVLGRRLSTAFAAFGISRRGSIAVNISLLIVVIAALSAFAIDYARAVAARSVLQDELDAVTLMAARIPDATDREVKRAAAEYLAIKLRQNETLIKPRGEWKVQKSAVTGEATATVKSLFGFPEIGPFNLRVKTQVRRGTGATEVALVLDTTGSMAGSRITALKEAANTLVTKLTEVKEADVKIAVIPFGQYVNVGVRRRSEPWANVPADYSQQVTPGCSTITQTTSCQTESYACTRYNDGIPYQATCTRSYNCVTTPVNPPRQHCPAPYTNNYRFYGCIGSPPFPSNVKDNDPSRRYPGFLNLTCGAEIMPLTKDAAGLKSTIDGLTPSGETYIPSGLAWGFNALSRARPLTEARGYDTAGPNVRPRKVLVLMTDGTNTKLMNPANGRHDISPPAGGRADQADDYTARLCANIKAENIELFSVAFEVDDEVTKKMLKKCATDKAHFFDASNSAELIKAFSDIATALQNLYIAK